MARLAFWLGTSPIYLRHRPGPAARARITQIEKAFALWEPCSSRLQDGKGERSAAFGSIVRRGQLIYRSKRIVLRAGLGDAYQT